MIQLFLFLYACADERRRCLIKTYKTAEVAAIIGIHPNTVRLYEKLKLIPVPERLPNGYRVFTEQHIAQCRLVRVAFQVEVLQNGLRTKVAKLVTMAATGDYDTALVLANEYLAQVRQERANAYDAIESVKQILSDAPQQGAQHLKRKDASRALGISTDTLRNWEMNGLLTVKRRENGYRVYTDEDMRRLKVIRSLRCANYSLEAILQLLRRLSQDPDVDIAAALNTPSQAADIISVYDRLILSLSEAEQNARTMLNILQDMKIKFSKPSI